MNIKQLLKQNWQKAAFGILGAVIIYIQQNPGEFPEAVVKVDQVLAYIFGMTFITPLVKKKTDGVEGGDGGGDIEGSGQ